MTDSPSRDFFDGNPKTMFTFGVVTGVAIVLVIQSIFGGSAALFAKSDVVNNPTVVTDPKTPTPTQGKMAEVTSADHIRGDLKKAKVVMVEYSDFECPFCSRHHPTLVDIFDDYGSDIAWVYRHFPLSFHPEANPAALASECAAEQGKFWEYADKLFENQDQLGTDYYKSLAKDLGLKTSQFNDCLDTKKYQDRVNTDIASGKTAGVTGTPATFINGTMVAGSTGSSVGAAPKATFTAIIDGLLKK